MNSIEAGPKEWTDVQRAAVREEMNRILADPIFNKSHRCVALLRSLIEHALAGNCDGIKERTLGIEVFGREADYDSNSDPIVRITAADVRKRLAQFHERLDDRHRVRIHLVPGSYLPQFDFGYADRFATSGETTGSEGQTGHQLSSAFNQVMGSKLREFTTLRCRKLFIYSSLCLLLVLAVGLALVHSNTFRSTQYMVWKPLLSSGGPVIVCLPDDSSLQGAGEGTRTEKENDDQIQTFAAMIDSRKAPVVPDRTKFRPTTPFEDARIGGIISNWLGAHGTAAVSQPSSAFVLQDFRLRPVVLIGGFDNPWSVILLSNLRFSLRVEVASGVLWVRDARNPAKLDWARKKGSFGKLVDYALITRIWDTDTGNWIVAISGLGRSGTEAASHLLTDPAFSNVLPVGIRSARNFQIVVKTQIINENPGPPQILAFDAW